MYIASNPGAPGFEARDYIIHGIARQQKFLTMIVSRMETYERAAAMPWSLTYRQSVLLGCTTQASARLRENRA